MKDSKVSVLIAAYNHEKYVEETLRSIADQDFPNLEIVVVDDCSPDGTVAAIERFIESSPVKVIFHRNKVNRGVAPSLNTAVGLATGDYVVIFASDDLFVPGRLARQVTFMDANPEVRVLYGNGSRMSADGTRSPAHSAFVAELLESTPQEILRYLHTNTSPIFLQTALIRRDFLNQLGGFDEHAVAEDWIMNCKIFAALQDRSQFAYKDEVAFIYRIHGQNIHMNFDRQIKGKLEFIELYTPKDLRREATTNIHRKVAQNAMNSGIPGLARYHAWKAFLAGRQGSDLELLCMTMVNADPLVWQARRKRLNRANRLVRKSLRRLSDMVWYIFGRSAR